MRFREGDAGVVLAPLGKRQSRVAAPPLLPGERWGAWARRSIARHTRGVGRFGGISLVWTSPARWNSTTRTVHHRSLRTVLEGWTIAPVISPLLRVTIFRWADRKESVVRHGQSVSAGVRWREARKDGRGPAATSQGTFAQARAPLAYGRAELRLGAVVAGGSVIGAGLRRRPVRGEMDDDVGPAQFATRSRRLALLAEGHRDVAHRVSTQRSRLELRGPRASLVLQRPPAGAAAEAGSAPHAPLAPAARAAEESRAVTSRGRSAIDIEQLTDQVVRSIDRRVIAHRERTGRVF
jgi:hypothetical protein